MCSVMHGTRCGIVVRTVTDARVARQMKRGLSDANHGDRYEAPRGFESGIRETRQHNGVEAVALGTSTRSSVGGDGQRLVESRLDRDWAVVRN